MRTRGGYDEFQAFKRLSYTTLIDDLSIVTGAQHSGSCRYFAPATSERFPLMQLTKAPCYGRPYCERGSCFIDQRGQDLLLAHLLCAVGIVAHRDRQLLHHLDPPGGCAASHAADNQHDSGFAGRGFLKV